MVAAVVTWWFRNVIDTIQNPQLCNGSTQEDRKTSRHDWKIVDGTLSINANKQKIPKEVLETFLVIYACPTCIQYIL